MESQSKTLSSLREDASKSVAIVLNGGFVLGTKHRHVDDDAVGSESADNGWNVRSTLVGTVPKAFPRAVVVVHEPTHQREFDNVQFARILRLQVLCARCECRHEDAHQNDISFHG